MPTTKVSFCDNFGVAYRRSYKALYCDAQRFSAALLQLGVSPSDRVAAMLWNNWVHLSAGFGTIGIGAVLHTLNPRLSHSQLSFIAEHAEDQVIVIEDGFLDLLSGAIRNLSSLKLIVVNADHHHLPDRIGEVKVCAFQQFLCDAAPSIVWGGFDKELAASLCYTSGTTGEPKGVLYSHRSTLLHAFIANQPNGLAIGADDTVLPIVPMFHASAWGIPFIAAMSGAELVLPGSRLDAESLCGLIESEAVTFAAAVPTVWQDVLRYLAASGKWLKSLRRVMIGGAAVSENLVRALEQDHSIEILHAWGMTEMSPVGSIASSLADRNHPVSAKYARRARQGQMLFPIKAQIVNIEGALCAQDDKSAGNLKVSGPTVARAYFKSKARILDGDRFFDTGDIAVRDGEGSPRLVDRSKDVIKSGGEWISTIDLENAAMTDPRIARAAVIAMAHEKWDERPMLIIECCPEREPTPLEVIESLRSLVPKWWLPDAIVYSVIPLGSTGKIDKITLRKLIKSEHAPNAIVVREAPATEAPIDSTTKHHPTIKKS